MRRPSDRAADELREVDIQANINKYAEGSCLIYCGDTQVICTATIEEKIPPFLRGKGEGWVTAEYNMIPRATETRVQRDRGEKVNSRALEIQRLIGRSLRSCVDMKKLGERQILIDCDVIQADGGTRCASITGGYVAMCMAINSLLKKRTLKENPITNFISAVSCGIYKGICILDFDYTEDSDSEADVNFVMNDKQEIVEVQGTAEGKPFPFSSLDELFKLASKGTSELIIKQKEALESVFL
ncbi:MAG: ribonuclease PH [Rickettsiales bacterium]|jgi:ribonuclease PH|nr:ribonuclease PH [Rickettsiales bacterium]